MAIKTDIVEDLELAKTYLSKSDLDDDMKKSLLKLLSNSSLATNGITSEEKIQLMTETLFSTVTTLVIFISSFDKKIHDADIAQCQKCEVHDKLDSLIQREHDRELLAQYNQAQDSSSGSSPSSEQPCKNPYFSDGNSSEKSASQSTADVIKTIFVKPYIYIFLSIAVFSPFLSDIVKQLVTFFTSK